MFVCVCLCVCVQLKSMLHNINFFLDSLVKGDLREVKGVRTSSLLAYKTVQLFRRVGIVVVAPRGLRVAPDCCH